MKALQKILVKIGGSLYHTKALTKIEKTINMLKSSVQIIIVPGGGPFADLARKSYKNFNLDEDSAHWMAIAAMDQYGWLLNGLSMGIVADSIYQVSELLRERRPVIFLPYNFLYHKDPLPHSWQVTSDSISAYLAEIFQPDLFVLLKPVDGFFQEKNESEKKKLLPAAHCNSIIACRLLDSYFNKVFTGSIKTWIVNGNYPERLTRLVEEGKTIGTAVVI